MPVCAVPTCATTHITTDKTLYRFPKDINYARIWVRCCMKKEYFNTKTAYICSLHFADEAYQRDINHDMLGYSSKKNLRKDAIPTLQLPSLRMFRKSTMESHSSDSLPMDVLPSLSPKNFLKNIEFDFLACPRVKKTRVKCCYSYMKYRTKSISVNDTAEAPVNNESKPTEKNDIIVECGSYTCNGSNKKSAVEKGSE